MLSSTVHAAALAYAAALVYYHELNEHCKTSTLREDQFALRAAYDALYDAQNKLSDAALSMVK